ncbi:MAG: (2Fe-2S) ferredoxin domain-containing protein [Bacteroidetes bacterium]|nr:(2Fe-2S) ferredoxin domain-containing protein [Bacteroidota bacterium]
MTKITSLTELKKLRDSLKEKMESYSLLDHPDSIIQVKVAMATCGQASGARPVFDYFKEELEKRNIPAMVTQTGCMSYCYAEPTIEVTIPGKNPVVFGFVNTRKADEIIERYIRKGELPDGVIPVNYETVISQ